MSIANTRDRKVRPTHPGEMLREDFMPDYGLSVSSLAKVLGVSRQTVNELLRGRRAVNPEMALRLSRLFGNTAEFWLNAQRVHSRLLRHVSQSFSISHSPSSSIFTHVPEHLSRF
jgi:addiction module HigA family antidote